MVLIKDNYSRLQAQIRFGRDWYYILKKREEKKTQAPILIARPSSFCIKDKVQVRIGWLASRDMPEVMRVERASFENAWTKDDFLRCLRQRNAIGFVAESNNNIVGFLIYELHRTRLHILNFAVHPAARRLGVGQQLIELLIHRLHGHYREKITLAVRERNLAAQKFFRAMGFKAIKLLRHYYEDSGEDAYQMEYRAGNDPDWYQRLPFQVRMDQE